MVLDARVRSSFGGGKVTVSMDGSTRAIGIDSPDAVKIGRLSLFVIKRGDRIGIRLKDPESVLPPRLSRHRLLPGKGSCIA